MAALMAALPDANVRIFYGSTEAGNVAALDHVDIARKPGRIGVPSVATTLRLDETGELWARNPVLFDGYLNQPEATAEVLVDGWYRTGDLAEVDDEGFWSIVGRARDIIRTGGETVAPAEVELALAAHPALADVAVVGIPDDRWGEVVCAVAVVAPARGRPTDRRRAARLVRGPPGGVQAPPPAGRGGRDPPHRRHPPGPAQGPRRAHPVRRAPLTPWLVPRGSHPAKRATGSAAVRPMARSTGF